MLILPKVPHHLRTLTSSVSRLINPAASTTGSAAAGPSVTFTSSGGGAFSSAAAGNPIIGGGGPFTSNSFLVGGGALTKTGEHAGGQLGFGAWAPYSGGAGGGAGAGRSKAGTGHYGYTGHARAFISSAPTAADISNTLLEEDDQDIQAALALHRSRLRSPSGSAPAPAHVRLQPDSLKIVRPQATLRLEDARSSQAGEERARLRELMRERSRRPAVQTTPLAGDLAREPASDGLIEEDRSSALDSQPTQRPRGRSLTSHSLPFGRSASSLLLASTAPATAAAGFSQTRALSSTAPAASSLQTETASLGDEEFVIFSDDFDSSVNTLAPASVASATVPADTFTSKSRSKPVETRAALADLPPVSSLPPPPQSHTNGDSTFESPLAPAPAQAAETTRLLGLGLSGPPPGLSPISRIGAADDASMDLTEPEPTLPQAVPEGYVDPFEVAHLDDLREAHYSASTPDVLEAARAYSDLPGIRPAPGLDRLPIQSTESFTATLKTLAANRPPGAPVDEIKAVWSAMLRKGVAPSVESYAVMIRVLSERQLEVAETTAFAKADASFVRKTSEAGDGERTNLMPEPVAYRFASQWPVASVCAENTFKSAFALFHTATTFPTLSSAPLPIETYDALLAACAVSPGQPDKAPEKALAVFTHLKQAVGQGTGLAYTYESFTGLIAAYAKARRMQDAETVLEGLQSAEKEGLVVLPAETLDIDARRITPWNAMIAGHFEDSDAAAAVAVVENLITPATESDALPPPAVQPSTFTTVIQGFLAADDLSSALSWFDRVAVADNALPPLEPFAYVALLAYASQTKDLKTFDHVFDRLTAHPPAGYHLRPLDVAEAIKLHLAAATRIEATAEEVSSHIDRIFEFVGRCDRHEHSRYLYPAILADSLLRLLVEHARIEELRDVYMRTIQAGQEDVVDPIAAVKFHAYFFESIVHWTTTPHAKPLPFSVTERLELLGLLSFVARQAGLPTDLTGEQIIDRILHLYEQAHIEAAGAPFLSEASGQLISDVEAIMRDRYEAANPHLVNPAAESAASDAAASIDADSGAGIATEVASQAGTDNGMAQTMTTASSVATETTPPSSLGDDLLASPSSLDDLSAAPVDSAEAKVGDGPYMVDVNLDQRVDAWRTPAAGAKRPTVLDCYKTLQLALQRGTVPSVKSLALMIGALGREREPEKAAEVLDLAHRVLLENGPQQNGVRLWYQIENQAIIAFAHCGVMDRANFHRMNIINSKAAPSPDAYSALVNAAKDTTDDAAVARLLFQEALSLGVEPNLFLYNTVISALSKARKSDEAIGLFHDMVKKGVEPSTVTYGTIVNAFCRTGDPINAIKFFDIMCKQPKFKARVPPFNTMMQYFTLTQPDRARVLHYYDRLVAAKVQPSSHTYNILMQAFGTIEPLDLRAMHKVFDTLRRSPHADARVEGLHWATLINCHGAVNKDLETALQVFDTIAEHNAPEVPLGQKGLPDAICWEAIFNVILIHRRFDLLATYIDRLAASGLQSTTYIQNVLIRALATEGSIEKARELFESMTDPPMGIAAPHGHPNRKSRVKPAAPPPTGVVHREPSTYEIMVRAELAAGEHERALRLCERMEERLYPVSVTAKIRGILGEDL